jgi:hypothetical protein
VLLPVLLPVLLSHAGQRWAVGALVSLAVESWWVVLPVALLADKVGSPAASPADLLKELHH